MSRKLSTMTTAQLRTEMREAGNPDKLIDMQQRMLAIMAEVDGEEELFNLELIMQRLLAEARIWKRQYRR